jgi:hypothetical protein
VAYTDAIPAWTLRMPAGSLQQWNLTLTIPAPAADPPYPVSGATFEYVARTSATDLSTPLIKITTTVSSAGLITVTSSASLSQLLLAIYPAATAAVTPGTYFHACWMNPGTDEALGLFGGSGSLLMIDGNPQP